MNFDKTYDIDKAKKAAIELSKYSLDRNCLFQNMPDAQLIDWENGDPETLETIASLACTEGVDEMNFDDAKSVVLECLEYEFPEFK